MSILIILAWLLGSVAAGMMARQTRGGWRAYFTACAILEMVCVMIGLVAWWPS